MYQENCISILFFFTGKDNIFKNKLHKSVVCYLSYRIIDIIPRILKLKLALLALLFVSRG